MVSGLRAEVDDDRFEALPDEPEVPNEPLRPFPSEPLNASSSREARRGSGGVGLLWALVVALVLALGGLGWWSHQQIDQMHAQLVATQESFAQISEEAAGRIQDISGKVVATESSVTSESEALKLTLRQLQNRLDEVERLLKKQQQIAGEQGSRLERAEVTIKAQQTASEQGNAQLRKAVEEQGKLSRDLAALRSSQAEVAPLTSRIGKLEGELAALKKADTSAAVGRLEQDLLVLRTQLDNRPAGQDNAEFDAFRAQTSRHINGLQGQIQNLQQQLDALRR